MSKTEIIASVSGGKDSTAMCLHFIEQGVEFKPVFMDTGWETAETYEYVRGYLPGVIGEITWLRAQVELPEELEIVAQHYESRLGHHSPMIRVCIKKGLFPSKMRRWCTESLKTKPMREYLAGLDFDPVDAVGIRAAESVSRSKMPEREWSDFFNCEIWRPLIRWSEQDVIDIHTRHGVRPNPGYLNGATRVGCWPCIYASKKELNHFSRDEERVSLLEDLEDTITALGRARIEARGEVPKHGRSGWFMNPAPKRDPETGKRSGAHWPIRKVLEWAKTKRGGKQFELFLPPERERGCMRWGLCDTGVEQ